jgi:hypothetical protein
MPADPDETHGDINRGGFAHIICIGFERQPKQADGPALEAAANHFINMLDHFAAAAIIHLHDRMQDARLEPLFLRHESQRLDILRETRASPSKTGIQEERTNALIVTHARRHFFHVRTERFTNVGNLVNKADLGRQEGVGGVLDHLRRAQVGDDGGGCSGVYSSATFSAASRLVEPRTIRSGLIKSYTPEPSRRNSGQETTQKSTGLGWAPFTISAIQSPVPTGTVDLLMMIQLNRSKRYTEFR